MSKLFSRHVFTSEAVSEGHPDKVCDAISDAVLDACLKVDPRSRVACETCAGANLVANLGEITCSNWDKIDPESIAREVVADIGYDDPEEGFAFNSFRYINALHGQSPDISQGIDHGADELQGAGDQGMMFGFATDETDSFMPAPFVFSHRLLDRFTAMRKNGEIPYLRPDSKAQVSVLYDNGAPCSIETVVISHQTRDVPIETIRRDIEEVARLELADTGLISNNTRFFINPTGKFVVGGPCGDSGVTGRKIIVDTYGGVGSHGGGAFSGKDPSKVDRSAAYYARYAAKNLVASSLAKKCEIQVAYAIGVAAPMSINVDTYGTGKLPDSKLADILLNGGIFDFRPGLIVRKLGLTTPTGYNSADGWTYRATSSGGHFGRDLFPWEKLDSIEKLKQELS